MLLIHLELSLQSTRIHTEVMQLSVCLISFCLCPFRLREGVRKMEEKHFSEHNEEHVEFLPVEWRSKLALDGGVCILFCLCISGNLVKQGGCGQSIV